MGCSINLNVMAASEDGKINFDDNCEISVHALIDSEIGSSGEDGDISMAINLRYHDKVDIISLYVDGERNIDALRLYCEMALNHYRAKILK
ncbi:hypothetical protein BCF11_5166 [Collimonas sp. PA-H2]|uniref:hypothetical protein n=1 Tax=Collimonas sp. PA-H2 TaxID=1881062 RepID=UPI000C01C15A|nr:hypothetical protein [Collimonas sp. PA-H2]PFH04391.1 hypothetical protein BCF11_5166 [Collimonas sp. PA-H2]